jgi:hypothetical protein
MLTGVSTVSPGGGRAQVPPMTPHIVRTYHCSFLMLDDLLHWHVVFKSLTEQFQCSYLGMRRPILTERGIEPTSKKPAQPDEKVALTRHKCRLGA